MPNEVDEFLGGLDKPVDDPFKPSNEDPFKKEGEVEVEGEEKVEEEKPLPYHKDPKLQRFIEKEVSKRLAEKPTETQQFIQETKSDVEDPLADVLTRIIGNDTPEKVSAIKDFKRVLGGLKDDAKVEALREIQSQRQAELEEDRKAEEELVGGLESIEERFGVDITSNAPQARKARTEYLTYIERIAPKDEQGQVTAYPDFEASFEDFQERTKRAPQPNNRAKELSSRSMARSGDSSTAPVSKDNSWSAVEKIFSKLTS